MASLITHTLTYSKEDIFEYVIKPLFVDNDIRDLVTIRTGIKSREKLDFFDKLEKITKAYARGTGFTSSSGVVLSQKTLTVSDMKAQIEQNGKEFEDSVKQELLASGWKINDIGEANALLKQVVLSVYVKALMSDFQRQIWFGDTEKETRVSEIPTSSADLDYSVYDGFWKLLIDAKNAASIASTQFVDMNTTTYLGTAAVAQVATNTIAGVVGTVDMTINGTSYTEEFDTSLTVTAAAFVTTHAATILAREGEVVVTSSGADIIVTSGIAGLGITVTATDTGGITNSIAATTANVDAGDLATDGALKAFRKAWESRTPEMKDVKSSLVYHVTSSMMDNYMTTIESGAHDFAKMKMIDGIERPTYRGTPIVEYPDWDKRIANDINYYPHRMLLTLSENLIVGVDGDSDDMDVEEWYEKKDQLRYWRTEYKVGTQFYHETLVVLGYA